MLEGLAWLLPADAVLGAAALLLAPAVALAAIRPGLPATGVAVVPLGWGLLARGAWRTRRETPA